jgi:hypothetical protein
LRRINNTLLILVYLLTGLAPCAWNSVVNITETFYFSQKKPTPKTHYFTTARINKHILPAQNADSGVALQPSYYETEHDRAEFILPAAVMQPLRACEVLTVSNKAPPTV